MYAASGPARWRSPSRRPARASPTSRRARRRTATVTTCIRGAKIFISGGDHDLTDNIVHMTLARIDGAPAGHQGRLALLRAEAPRRATAALVDNDVQRRRPRPQDRLARPAEPRRSATASAAIAAAGSSASRTSGISLHVPDDERGAHHGRPERRRHGVGRVSRVARVRARRARRAARSARRDPARRRSPIIEHADVRRMLLRQKAIVEGGLALVARAALLRRPRAARDDADEQPRAAAARSAHADRQERSRPSAGFESNALARADPRRLRLLERVPARGVAARSEAQHHPRGHDRHPGGRPARSPRGREGRGGAGRARPRDFEGVRARARGELDRGPPRRRAIRRIASIRNGLLRSSTPCERSVD